MEVTVLGTGTSQGVPVIACQCEVCQSVDQHDKRLRSAVMISDESTCLVVDAGADFRQQMLTHQVKKIDGLLITHGHKDHTGGLDDVRAFNWIMKKPIDIWARNDVQDIVKREFPYAFGDNKYPGAPEINLRTINEDKIQIGSMRIIPVNAFHGKLAVTGFRIGAFSYLTDASRIDNEELKKMKGSRVIIINALRQQKHHSHFSLDEAVAILEYLAPEKGYITHISHQMGFHRKVQQLLPENVFLAYDGLVIKVGRSEGLKV